MRSRIYTLILICLALLIAGCTRSDDLPMANIASEDSTTTTPWWEQLPRPEWSAFERVDDDQGWFEVYHVQPGIYAIYEPGHWQEVISYLITGADRALLFDTGMGIGDILPVVQNLTDLEVLVLNSHSHFDHTGGNHRFDTIYGMDLDYTRTNAAGVPPEQARRFIGEGSIWQPTPEGFSPETYHIEPFSISHTIAEGDRIDLGDRVLEVFHTPGHAPDALCLLDRANRLLFTGDTFYPAPLYAQLPGSNVTDYAASAARLATMTDALDHLLPGHNVPLVDAVYLQRMHDAFQAIANETTPFEAEGEQRRYSFDGFSIIVPAH